MSDWPARAGALADTLVARGAIGDPSWRAVFAETPRHVFVPCFWDTDAHGRPGDLVHRADREHHSVWLAAVYGDRALATQLATMTVGDTEIPVVSQAAPAPSVAAVMLDRLALGSEHRVWEIGTGTGYLTALLAARVGGGQVTSTDVDPGRLGLAADHLYAVGHRPGLAIADPLEGWPAGAPYDRILVGGAVSQVPPAWIEQLAAGGRIVVPLEVGHALAVLERTSRTELTGRIDHRAVEILALPTIDRPSSPVGCGSPSAGSIPEAKVGTTALSPSVLADPDVRLWLALHLPDLRILDVLPSPSGTPIATVIYTEHGRAAIGHHPTGERCWVVAQDGDRIWATVEAALHAYYQAGRPPRHRLGLTIRAQPPEQTVWLDSPHSPHQWPLPGSCGE